MFSRQDTILRGKGDGDNYQNWSMLIGASRNLVLDNTTVFLKYPFSSQPKRSKVFLTTLEFSFCFHLSTQIRFLNVFAYGPH